MRQVEYFPRSSAIKSQFKQIKNKIISVNPTAPHKQMITDSGFKQVFSRATTNTSLNNDRIIISPVETPRGSNGSSSFSNSVSNEGASSQ